MQTPDGVIPAAGKSVEIRSCRIVEIEGDKVKSIRQYYDQMTMMQQLGLASLMTKIVK
jgi:predicted ester cyclase